MKRFDSVEKKRIVDLVDRLRSEGHSKKEACKEAKINGRSYNYFRTSLNKSGKKKSKPSLTTLSLPAEKQAVPFVFMMGNPSDIHSALERLAQIRG